MRFRRLVLLVGLYVALDFANPMMPGAVQLVGGSLQTVAGCQARSAEEPAPVTAVLPRHLSVIQPQRHLILPAARMMSTPSFTPVLFRTSFEPRSTPASSPDDD